MLKFKQLQPQKWNVCAGFSASFSSSAGLNELKYWSGLGLLSLAIAGVFAFLLAFSRVPHINTYFHWPIQFFEKGLVIHVIFSFVVWFLSIFNTILIIATYRLSAGEPKLKGIGYLSLTFGIVAFLLILIPGCMDRGEPSLNNYIPVIIDPIYYLGLILFSLSVLSQIIRLAVNLLGRLGPLEPITMTSILGCGFFLLALICFLSSLQQVWGDPIDANFNENIFWAPGHVLQFLNTLLMILAWYIMGGSLLGRPIIDPKFFKYILFMFAIAGLVLLSLIFFFDPISVEGREAFTSAQFLMLPLIISFFFGVGANFYQNRIPINSIDWHKPITLLFLVSIIVFGIGGTLGIFVDGADTRTPAHYHGVIGGVNLSFIGLFFYFIAPILKLSVNENKKFLALIWCYGVGQIMHSLGLYFAGGYGAPRKTPGNIEGLTEIGAELSLYAMGIGAVIAVLGGILFILIAGKTLFSKKLAVGKT